VNIDLLIYLREKEKLLILHIPPVGI